MQRHLGTPLEVEGPLSDNALQSPLLDDTDLRVVQGTSERMALPTGSVDLALTDPPYHDDVQYGELSLPFRAWSQLSVDSLAGEAVVNAATRQCAGPGEYRALLTRIFAEVRRTLKPHGRLILSYANREPDAWIDLFAALKSAEFRAIGCAVVRSDNETDHVKRGVRACTLDLIMELSPRGVGPIEQWRGDGDPTTDEEQFLRLVADTFVRVGSLTAGWDHRLDEQLSTTRFLSRPSRD